MPDKAILCVDDEAILLVSLKMELESFFQDEYLIETAMSATEAEETISELEKTGKKLILVISDWLMPGMKGDEFLIRIHGRYPNIKAIMLTGQADADSIRNVREQAGLQAVLTKPWDSAELIGHIRQSLNN